MTSLKFLVVQVVQHYYNVFNRTLAEFGLILRHLGTTYNDFLYEVKRALRGQFLCVAFIIPIGKQTRPSNQALPLRTLSHNALFGNPNRIFDHNLCKALGMRKPGYHGEYLKNPAQQHFKFAQLYCQMRSR